MIIAAILDPELLERLDLAYFEPKKVRGIYAIISEYKHMLLASTLLDNYRAMYVVNNQLLLILSFIIYLKVYDIIKAGT
jgi:hypothetical protein